jgi:hypothetical protein
MKGEYPMENQTGQAELSILDQLTTIAREGAPIVVYNSFHGLLIESPVHILSQDRQKICLKMQGFQAACVYLEKRVLIQAAGMATAVEGYLHSIDIPEKTAWIDQLTPSSTRLNRRKSQRVQPESPVRVTIHRDHQVSLGQLADLSSEGIGIFTFGTTVGSTSEIQVGDILQLSLIVPIVNRQIEVSGQVTSISSEEIPTMKRIGICSNVDSPVNFSLLDYISYRQAEILRELEIVYERLLNQ